MLMSIRIGTNDVAAARRFYDATFGALGAEGSVTPATAPMAMYRLPDSPRFLVGPAADGAPASPANGGTILFTAASRGEVDAWHAAGLANGGCCEGAPAPRPRARDRYGAYLRDPDGNKLGCYEGNLFG